MTNKTTQENATRVVLEANRYRDAIYPKPQWEPWIPWPPKYMVLGEDYLRDTMFQIQKRKMLENAVINIRKPLFGAKKVYGGVELGNGEFVEGATIDEDGFILLKHQIWAR